jgi:hypothetical protein
VSGTADRGVDPRLRFDTSGVCCACGSRFVIVDAAAVSADWWLVTLFTEHRRRCSGLHEPARVVLVDVAAGDRGDFYIPGVEAESLRCAPRWLESCQATATTTGLRCRNRAGPDGLCGTHRRRS